MSVFLLSFTIIAVAFLGMAVGVVFGRPPLNAGCCGQASAGCLGTDCGFCAEGRRRRAGAPDGPIVHGNEQ